MKTFMAGVLQVMGLMVFARLMNLAADGFHLPIPGSILGIIVLFLLLQLRIVKLEWVDVGAKWLLAEMLLFLIPPAVGIMEYGDLIRAHGLQLFAAVTGSMLVVMAGSGLLADRLAARSRAKEAVRR